MPPRVEAQCVYLLRSMRAQHVGSTYIGYTTHPLRRIRQHNGEVSAVMGRCES